MGSIRRISVNFQASGTGEFKGQVETLKATVTELGATAQKTSAKVEQATTKVEQFGKAHAHAVSGTQATSAALRDLELKFNSNLRAAENFLATTLGLGDKLKLLFPITGGLAFAGMLYEMSHQVQAAIDWFHELAEQPSRVQRAFASMNEGVLVANEELKLTGVRLDSSIAKLEHKPVNHLKEALEESTIAALKLDQQLTKAIDDTATLLKKEQIGAVKSFFTGNASTSDLSEKYEGFQQKLGEIRANYQGQLVNETNPLRRSILANNQAGEEQDQVRDLIKQLQLQKQAAQILQNQKFIYFDDNLRGHYTSDKSDSSHVYHDNGNFVDQTTRLNQINGLLIAAYAQANNATDTFKNQDKQKTLGGLQDQQPAAAVTDAYKHKVQELQSELDKARDKAKYFGDDLGTKVAEGVDRARAAIRQLNEERKQQGLKPLTQTQEGVIGGLTYQTALAQHELVEDQKLHEAVNQNVAKAVEEKKKAFEQDIRNMTAYADGLQKFNDKLNVEDAKSAEAISKIQSEIRGIGYVSDATFGTEDEKRKAARAQYAGKLNSSSGMSDAERNANLELYDAQQKLKDKDAGRDMSLGDGFKGFFNKLSDNTHYAARDFTNVLGSAFQGVGDQLSLVLSGQKTSWGGFFQSLSQSFAQFGMNQIFGLLSGAFGGGKGGGGGILSALLGGLGHRAEGGSVMSGSAYMVGERGPELFMPGMAGGIVPNHALAGIGAGGFAQHFSIDARGTDPNLTERNVRRAIGSSSQMSTQSAVMAIQELQRRRR